MTPSEIERLGAYLKELFDNNRIRLKFRPQAADSVEVLMEDEFIGLVYKDEDEGEISYQFQMALIEEDLPEL